MRGNISLLRQDLLIFWMSLCLLMIQATYKPPSTQNQANYVNTFCPHPAIQIISPEIFHTRLPTDFYELRVYLKSLRSTLKIYDGISLAENTAQTSLMVGFFQSSELGAGKCFAESGEETS